MRIKFNIDEQLKKTGLNRHQVSIQMGIHSQHVYGWCKNERLPLITNAVKLMQILDCSFDDIFEIVEE